VADSQSRKLLIHGKFTGDTFSAWITNRAERLSLQGWVRVHGRELIEVCMFGDRILIDAMEVACSLGPIDAQIERIDSQNVAKSTTRHPHQLDGYSLFTSFGPKHVE